MSKKLLILGGNGFIGAEVIEYLSEYNQNYEFILLNRGHWNDWDLVTRIKPKILESIIFDRKTDSLKECLKDYLEDTQIKFEALIDFSGYKIKDIKNVMKDLSADKIKRYIYISSDSVYEVSEEKISDKGGQIISNECDANRPESKSRREFLKEFDSYGHHKLKCEEYLECQSKNGIPYICLRLPDVIGPRDSTNRFWLYQMWLQYLNYKDFSIEHEICIPKLYFNLKTSYVYVKDVAKVIDLILKSDIKNEEFNLAFKESLSLIDLLDLMAKLVVENSSLKLKFKSVENIDDCPPHSFPSVTKGSVSTDKIKRCLNFEFTSIEDAFKETIAFYNSAYRQYPKHRTEIEKDIKKDFLKKGTTEMSIFTNFIENFTKINL